MKNSVFLFLVLLFLQACSSEEIISDNSHPYSDIQEGFMTQEVRTYREGKYQPNQYFYKNCDQRRIDNHYSKTEYFCNER